METATSLSIPLSCAYKNPCDACPLKQEKSQCVQGHTCKSELVRKEASDGCHRVTCSAGRIQLYKNGQATNDKFDQLYCTISNRWSNFSHDGAANGAGIIKDDFTANCILPVGCENCANPTMATSLSQLPSTFRTGYAIANAIYTKQSGVCSTVKCPLGYTLHGFNGAATAVTGMEYTNRGWMEYHSNSQWTNGQYAYTPQEMVAACLRKEYPCGCSYNKDSSLIATRESLLGQSCNITCPSGYRMVVNGEPVQKMTCDGAVWKGAMWLAGYNQNFDFYATVKCEQSPFTTEFSWPLVGMRCGGEECANKYLTYSDGVLSCNGNAYYKLVVSSSRTKLINGYMLANVTWNGYVWNGVDTTGTPRSFDKDHFFTCYDGEVPAHRETPCGCAYILHSSDSGEFDSTYVSKLPPSDGLSCILGCPTGYRLIVHRKMINKDETLEDLKCQGNNKWIGRSWLSGIDAKFDAEMPSVSCELSPFPKGNPSWSVSGMSCDSCHNEHLMVEGGSYGKLECRNNFILTVSNDRASLVNPDQVESLKWSNNKWTGAEVGTQKTLSFPSSVYITCYSGKVLKGCSPMMEASTKQCNKFVGERWRCSAPTMTRSAISCPEGTFLVLGDNGDKIINPTVKCDESTHDWTIADEYGSMRRGDLEQLWKTKTISVACAKYNS